MIRRWLESGWEKQMIENWEKTWWWFASNAKKRKIFPRRFKLDDDDNYENVWVFEYA